MTRYLPLLLLCLVLVPIAAHAQYMYLDSNGDGVHSAADVLSAIGTTQVDIWLRTDHLRDGSSAICPTGEAYTINSYTVILRASNGTVAWTNPTNLQPSMPYSYGVGGTSTEFHMGALGASTQPPGDYHLARLTVTILSGEPGLEIVARPLTLPLYYMTSFGSACVGRDFDNTQKLGSDWFQADGLPYSSGGVVNRPPVIPLVTDMSAAVGQITSQDLLIAEPDGEPITAALGSGPAFIHVTPIETSLGASAVRIHLQPHRGDEGEYEASIVATDGLNQASRSFHVTITPGANHSPVVAGPGPQKVVATSILRYLLRAADEDGDPLTFRKLDGPAFAEIQTARPGHGGGTGYIILRPTLCDIGTSALRVQVDDGYGSTIIEIPIQVLAPSTPPAVPTRMVSIPNRAVAVASGDFNEDGHADAVTVGEFDGAVLLLLGDGSGNLAYHSRLMENGHLALAIGDWNQDAHLDVAVGAYSPRTLSVLYGNGNGTFQDPVTFAGLNQTTNFAVGDYNRDGADDLVMTAETNELEILLGRPGSGLIHTGGIRLLGASKDVATADFDQDGILDIAVTGIEPSGVVRIFHGRGDGTFGAGWMLPMSRGFYAVVTGDWNYDGIIDLSTGQFYGTGTYALVGNGEGAFTPSLAAASVYTTFDLAVLDWNADGRSDLAVTVDAPSGTLLLGEENGSFVASSFEAFMIWGLAVADLNEDGRPDVLATSGGTGLTVRLNTTTAPTGTVARAFLDDPTKIAAVPSSRLLCGRIEPQSGAFDVSKIDASSIRLRSEGTGSVSSIGVVVPKQATIGDTDRNGIAEYPACFSMTEFAKLFDLLRGRSEVTARLEGSLVDGRRFCAPITMTVVGGGGTLAARVEPNPLNPRGILRFSVDREGPVTVRLFDIQGRLVRTLWDAQKTPPGSHEAVIDGRDRSGQVLGTGVYFFSIEADGSRSTGRFTVLK